jgi:NAD-dependent deacetylase
MNDADRARSRGIAALLAGSLIVADEALSTAVMDAPFDPIAWHDLALVHRLRGALDPAGRASATAVCLDHPDPVVRGTILRQHALHERLAGRVAAAEEVLARALEADPTHAVGWYLRGLFARLDGRLDRAIEGFERALRVPCLPALVRSRVEGMLADLRAMGPEGLVATDSPAMVAAVSEPLLSDGVTAPLDLDLSEAAPSSDTVTASTGRGPAPGLREVTVETAARLVHRARSITVLTGAGCSSASGLPTRKELWRRFDKDAVVTVTHHTLRALWLVVLELLGAEPASPNPAHRVIAALPRVRAIVTQNVDALHQVARDEAIAARRAASPGPSELSEPPVIELHGALDRLRCEGCGAADPRTAGQVVRAPVPELPPTCAACGSARVRPDVVLFGEWVDADALARAVEYVCNSDLLLVVGCAMDVAPASELPRLAAARGATVLEVNPSPSRLSRSIGTALLRGPAERTLPALFDALQRLEALPSLPSSPSIPPRAIEVALRAPRLGARGESGRLGRYLAEEGASVQAGARYVELEIDKVTTDLEAPLDGTIVRLHRRQDETVREGDLLATLRPDTEGAVAELARTAFAHRRGRASAEPAAIAVRHGAHPDAVRALFARICAGRLLRPDADLSAPSAEGLAWLHARVHALCGSLGLGLGDLSLRVFRDARAALEAVHDDPRLAGLPEGIAEPPAWLRAFAAAARTGASGDATEEPTMHRDLLRRGVDEALLRARFAAKGAARRVLHTLPTSLGALAWRAARRVAREGEGAGGPFEPMLAIWLRGAWPFALGDAIGVWIPTYEGEVLVCDGRAGSPEARARWPLFLGRPVRGVLREEDPLRALWSVERGWPYAPEMSEGSR